MPNSYHFRFPDLEEERRTVEDGGKEIRQAMRGEWRKWGTPEARDRGRIAAAALGLRLNLPEKPKNRLSDEANKRNLDLVRTFVHQPADTPAEEVWRLLERSAGAGAAIRSRVDKQGILRKAGREKERDEARIKALKLAVEDADRRRPAAGAR